jgi:hypothetical protein
MAVEIVDVVNVRVADVHIPEITVAVVIPRIEGLAKAQRAPAKAAAKSEAYTKARSTEPRHKCRSIYRAHINRSGSPAPITARVNPASVVEGGITPWSVIDPSPAPRFYVGPVAG